MGMVRPKPPKPNILEQDIQGAKYFKVLGSLLEDLHDVGTDRDKAGNRQLYFDPTFRIPSHRVMNKVPHKGVPITTTPAGGGYSD